MFDPLWLKMHFSIWKKKDGKNAHGFRRWSATGSGVPYTLRESIARSMADDTSLKLTNLPSKRKFIDSCVESGQIDLLLSKVAAYPDRDPTKWPEPDHAQELRSRLADCQILKDAGCSNRVIRHVLNPTENTVDFFVQEVKANSLIKDDFLHNLLHTYS